MLNLLAFVGTGPCHQTDITAFYIVLVAVIAGLPFILLSVAREARKSEGVAPKIGYVIFALILILLALGMLFSMWIRSLCIG